MTAKPITADRPLCSATTGRRAVAVVSLLFSLSLPVTAQDLEPRSLSNAPVGMNFLILGYGYSFGNVLLDAALPVEDARGRLNIVPIAYARAIDVFGLSGKVDVIVPFTWGTWEGRLAGQDTSTSRTGFGDPRLRLSVNFVGAPALRGRAFFAYRQRTIVGASLQVRAPLGQYDPTKLINLGSNRWTFRPQVGVSHRARHVVVEGYVSGWFFTENTDLLGTKLSQKPIVGVKSHFAYLFSSGIWAAVDLGYGTGGRTAVDNLPNEAQQNFRLGGTLAVPVALHHSLKFALATGVTTRVGADFDTILVAYQYRWGGLR